MGKEVREIHASDYTAIIEALRTGQADMAYIGSLAVGMAMKRAKAVPIVMKAPGGDKAKAVYRSVIVARADNKAIASIRDLKGRTMAFVDPDSTSGNLIPTADLIAAFPGEKLNSDLLHANGRFFEASFARGRLVESHEGETRERNGTFVSFLPDVTIFPKFAFREEHVQRRLRMYAYLNAGLSLELNGETLCSENGLTDLINAEAGMEQLYEPISFRSKMLEVAFTHSNHMGEDYYSFVNGQYTNDGGTHLSAFKEGVLKAINAYTGKSYKADEVRDGMAGAIAIKLKDPVFESQTKNKLGNTDVKWPIVEAVKTAVEDFLHRNREVADILVDKVIRNEQLHRQIQEAKKKSREAVKKTSLRIPKLKDCKLHRGDKGKKGEPVPETMIFLTEGDSAAGSLEKCRNVNTQAIFALKGKPLNVFGEKRDKIYSNDELLFIMQALDIENDIDNLRYDKVIIATDADVDGMHIRNLLMTYFLSFFDQLVMHGHLFVLETPLYRASLHTNYFLWVLVGLAVTAVFILGLYIFDRKRRRRRTSRGPDGSMEDGTEDSADGKEGGA